MVAQLRKSGTCLTREKETCLTFAQLHDSRVRREKVRTAFRRRPVLEQTQAKKSQRELRGGWPVETLCELFARGARVTSPQHASSEKVAARMDGIDPVGEPVAKKSQGLQPSATSCGDATCEKVAAA